MATPEELRAAADAFARVGTAWSTDPLGDRLRTAMADSQAMVEAILRGDNAEAERLKTKMGITDDDLDDDEEEEDDDE